MRRACSMATISPGCSPRPGSRRRAARRWTSPDGAVRARRRTARSRPTRWCWRPAISRRRRRAGSIRPRSARSGSTIPGPRGSPRASAASDVVLLLGTGLTAVDAALTLEATGFRGPDRRAVAARPRAARPSAARADGGAARGSAAGLRRDAAAGAGAQRRGRLAQRRARAAHASPRAVGRGAAMTERRRFLRHLRPWWDVHRHKLAPAVGATIEAMQGEARLAVAGGRLVSVEPDGGRARSYASGRAARTAVERLRVARIVNCTGPGDRHRPRRRAVARRPARRAAGSGPIRCASASTSTARLPGDRRGRRGRATTSTLIGPVTRGTFWESVAVPDIRVQAARVAERMTPIVLPLSEELGRRVGQGEHTSADHRNR